MPAALLAEDRFRNLGHALLPDWLVTRTGSLIRRRAVLDRRPARSARRCGAPTSSAARGLTTLAVTTAAGRQRYAVPDLGHDVAIVLSLELLPLAAQFIRAAERIRVPPHLLRPRARVTRLREHKLISPTTCAVSERER